MATDVTVFTKRPEYALVKQEASAITKALVGGSGFSGKRISIKGGVFRLISDGKEVAAIDERFLDVVITRAAEHIGRTYYAAAYDEDKPAAPDCWSADGVKPDTKVKNLQSPQCSTCAQNVKGSGTEDARACRYSQRVAVVLANDMEGDVLQLNLPATSLFGKEEGDNRPLQAYARQLAANNANIEQFITRLKFDIKAPNPKLFFKPMRWLTEEEVEVVKQQGLTDDAMHATTMTVSQIDKVPPQPAKAAPAQQEDPPAPAPKAKAKEPVADEEPPAPAPSIGKKRGRPAKEAPAPEPTVRAAAAAPGLPPRANIADIAAKWETDD